MNIYEMNPITSTEIRLLVRLVCQQYYTKSYCTDSTNQNMITFGADVDKRTDLGHFKGQRTSYCQISQGMWYI